MSDNANTEVKQSKIIGIDLGTTNSAVAIYDTLNDTPKIYENRVSGKRTTPSVISYKKIKGSDQREWIVGEPARNSAAMNPLLTFYGVKRLIGRKFNEPEIAQIQEMSSFKIVKGPNGDAWVDVEGTATPPEAISAKVLRLIKEQVEEHLGEEVNRAVITVPAYFNDAQRQATIDAGKMAGLKVERIINEPTAAALAYGMNDDKDSKVAVFDLGGGTFDVSVLHILNLGDENLIKVLGGHGDTFLGGEGFDEIITEHLINHLKSENEGFNPDASSLQRIRMAAEKAKITLSGQSSTVITEGFLGLDAEGQQVNLEYEMSRSDLEALLRPEVEKTIGVCKIALENAGIGLNSLDKVIMVGGQTRMPLVYEIATTAFEAYMKPDANGQKPLPDKSVNVDEIVAMGASVQGAIIDGGVDNVMLADVTPMSIGIRLSDGSMLPVIPRGTPLPFDNEQDPNNKPFSTSRDEQENFHIQLFQGERPMAADNRAMGDFVVDNLPPLPKGVPQLKVVMNIDENSVLTVTATDITNPNNPRKFTHQLQSSGGLSASEVEKWIKDAEANVEKDRALVEMRNARSQADDLLNKAKKDVDQEYFTSSSEETRQAFKEAVDELTAARQGTDGAVIAAGNEKLSKLRQDMAKAFYNQGATNDDATPEAPAAGIEAPSGPTGP